MPLDKFVLILVIVVFAAGLTIWLGSMIVAGLHAPLALTLLIPAALVLYVVWRVIAQRLSSHEDDHYDQTPR
ncbi:hypothetical protein [Palleronia pelagia]|uniref:Uncharacterized protein n=1 Tax=Palleronia pelagia TaxID=387096 RepID=A0A1H8AAW8_9RHOB|nr:hypothetical protein [Palleronia pelagia]SEM67626.1 hypothetical protein SAMN04488011_10182 [Palleronia pelagia]